nr:MAG TPA: hypothetical protein [Caudoviricetes sp.]
MNNLSPIFMVKRNHQYSITMDFMRDRAVGFVFEPGNTSYIQTISIPKKDLNLPKVIDRDGYAVLYNDRDGYEAWELTLFDLNKNPIVVPVIVLKELRTYVVDDLRPAVGKLERLHIHWGEFIHTLDYEYPTLWGTETDHWTFEMVTPTLYKIMKNGKRYSLTDDPYGTSPIEAIYRHLYKVYKPLETI